MISRRNSLKLSLGIAGAALAPAALTSRAFARTAAPAATGKFTLPPLGYAYEALEPHIDAMTMNLHHTKHHQAYITSLNGFTDRWAELDPKNTVEIMSKPSMIPEAIRSPVRNNLGGHFNHSFLWDLMTPGGAREPDGGLKAAIDSTFTSATEMMTRVNTAAAGRFGSGWAWLVVNKDKRLDIVTTPNQDTPLETGAMPIIGVDVWEHAYYLKYQNRRPDYLKSWWNTVNWTKAAGHFDKAMG